jgi:NAD(P)-dependent dehydrogenase (short-subunit alcohol dehydrogenase family)
LDSFAMAGELCKMKTINELTSLVGRCALLTGGTGNIGQAVAETLIELGARVAIVDLDKTACRKRAKSLGINALPIACDLKDEQATRETVRGVIKSFGGLDILIHCAAYVGTTQLPGWGVPFDQQTVEAWDNALRVNLTSAFILVQEAREALIISGHGSIIFFSSTYGIVGPDLGLYENTMMANPAGYGASKGGLLQLTRYLATVLAPRVRVNAISPGGIWRHQPEIFRERYETRTPLHRMASEEDLKGASAFLASDLSAYVTGHNLVVDGGWTAW